VRELEGKVAVITGAGSGIGRATALLFARHGAWVCSASRTLVHAEATAQAIAQEGGQAIAVQVDVSKRSDVQAMAEQVIPNLGRVDILCNNAGIGHTGSILECGEDEWDTVMAVNVKGVYLCSLHFLPHMLAQGEGNIINIASVVGLVGVPKRAVYSASKGAVIALTRQMAVEYVTENIRVNCICPGTVDSPWVDRLLSEATDPEVARQRLVARQPLGRLGTPEEIAHAALYLASPESAFATGSVLVIDGGLTAR
jgi:NAD(P)-dependent dehydrogenase (short-subunit alcohol dehydrogenase family)